MNDSKLKDIFYKYCDLTTDVGDENIEEVEVMSIECFKNAVKEILNERLQSENNSNNDGKIMRYKIKLIRVFELDENIIRERCSEYGMEPTEENMKQCAEEIARGWYGFNADSKDSVGAEVEKIE